MAHSSRGGMIGMGALVAVLSIGSAAFAGTAIQASAPASAQTAFLKKYPDAKVAFLKKYPDAKVAFLKKYPDAKVA